MKSRELLAHKIPYHLNLTMMMTSTTIPTPLYTIGRQRRRREEGGGKERGCGGGGGGGGGICLLPTVVLPVEYWPTINTEGLA